MGEGLITLFHVLVVCFPPFQVLWDEKLKNALDATSGQSTR